MAAVRGMTKGSDLFPAIIPPPLTSDLSECE